MSLELIESRYKDIALKLAQNNVSNDLNFSTMLNKPLPKKPDDWGGIFYGFCNGVYFESAIERGNVNFKNETKDPEEFLGWIVKRSAWGVALKWELKNRALKKDSRRLHFNKNIELLRKINSKWALEQEKYYDEILKLHPFDDASDCRIEYCKKLRQDGIEREEAWSLAIEKYPQPKGA